MLRHVLLCFCLLALAGCMPALRLDEPPGPPPWARSADHIPGNAVTILATGPETYDAMHAAIAQARHHIHVETYILCDDGIGRTFTDRLIERSTAGVAVRVAYDHQGSHLCTNPAFWQRLERAGVAVAAIRPPSPEPIVYADFHRRNHRKLVIVDGRIAFTGGINLNDVYAASPYLSEARDKAWRDTNVRIAGPAVADFQRLFLRRWRAYRTLPVFEQAELFPALPAQGDAAVAAVSYHGGARHNPIYRNHLAAIRHAERRIWLTHVYFTPEPNLVNALIAAAQRGVDVRLLLPGITDWPLIRRIAHSAYEQLLAGGVRIYEHFNAYLHAKTAVIDGRWSSIGSANLDYRSFLHNDEVNASMLDPELARRMEALFLNDLTQAQEITLEAWRGRPLWQRLQESLSRWLAYWL